MDVVLERFGFDGVENTLQAMGASVRPPRVFELWADITDDLIGAERRLFASERGWKDIKTSTIQRKSRDKDPKVRANNYKTNVGTGALRDHMTSKGPGAQPLRENASGLDFGLNDQSDVFYGKFQVRAGRDPRISKGAANRIAKGRIQDHIGHVIGGDFGTGSGQR